MIKKFSSAHGLFFVILLSSIIIFIFYGSIIKSPNYVFFAPGGDGLKSSFGSYYHYVHDTTYMHTYSMNYPYGESVFFTGNQPLIVNTLKFVSNFGFDFSNNIIGILNIWMILTLLIGVICIYFIFIELKLPPLYSAFVAITIAFLSPQVERFSGHYNLAYLFVLPLLLLCLIKYYHRPSYLKVVITSAFAFIAMYIHGYFFAFYSIWIIVMLVISCITDKGKFPLYKSLFQAIIFIALPIILFEIITGNTPSDRTSYPWGGIESASYLESVFLPAKLPFHIIIHRRVSYYIGLTSTVVFILMIVSYFKNIKNNKNKFLIIENRLLNSLLYGSIIALIFSFVWPFKFQGSWPSEWSLNFLFNYMGPLRQFRGTGRFSWMFYYVINIISYYYIWQWFSKTKYKYKNVVLTLILIFGLYESIGNLKLLKGRYNNKIEVLEDFNNNLPQNQWLKQINPDQFQAIIPLPYYHVGSETFWVYSGSEIQKSSFFASWKTGLPLTSVMLSRTSFSQTMNNIQLFYEPIRPFTFTKHLPNKKDFLVVQYTNDKLTQEEERFLRYSTFITKNESLAFYALSIDSINKLQADYVSELFQKINDQSIRPEGSFSDDYDKNFIYQSFGNTKPSATGRKSLSIKACKKNTIIDTILPTDTNSVIISFWIKGMDEDLIPRTRFELQVYRNDLFITHLSSRIFNKISYIDENNWGLCEFEYKPRKKDERIVISLRNQYTTHQKILIDDILIRKSNVDVIFSNDSVKYINNRYLNDPSLLD
jgi:hypothetical protein